MLEIYCHVIVNRASLGLDAGGIAGDAGITGDSEKPLILRTELLLGNPGAGVHVPGVVRHERAGSVADTRNAGILLRLFRGCECFWLR
ncbi:hypothetical protein D623_10016161 [Myotis brandtii]|uniref:Uncharacterized protein n=1 Tax=Myotis brandtii TaxID=109478 RepID=S7MRC4_MYOBR|nr:hypothetical protein D623_10016161 [Myotis brandtii]